MLHFNFITFQMCGIHTHISYQKSLNSVYFPIQEIANLLALEEATLSTDLQQGYALKSLTGTLVSVLLFV